MEGILIRKKQRFGKKRQRGEINPAAFLIVK
jgi:hypothetical protein